MKMHFPDDVPLPPEIQPDNSSDDELDLDYTEDSKDS